MIEKKQYLYNARVFNIVDGDTIDVEVDLGFKVYTKVRLRLLDINTPERGEPYFNETKFFVSDLLEFEDVVIETYKTGRYGRWLAHVYLDGKSVVPIIKDHWNSLKGAKTEDKWSGV